MAAKVSNSTTDALAQGVPHSWDLSSWPTSVWPGDPKRALWVARAYRSELVEVGALARSGKTLIILGRGYARWLDGRKVHVRDWDSNNPAMRSGTRS